MSNFKKLNRDQMAARLARDIPDGAIVNLGIGLPTLVANHLPKDREIILHSENGVLGMGPAPAAGEEDEDLINAGTSTSAYSAPSRCPQPATSPTGTPAGRTPFLPWAAPWTWPSAPRKPTS